MLNHAVKECPEKSREKSTVRGVHAIRSLVEGRAVKAKWMGLKPNGCRTKGAKPP